jgi:hypothetical protein
VGRGRKTQKLAARHGRESTLAGLPVRRRTETDETEEDRREQNRKEGRESVENENVLFGNVIFSRQ